MEIEPVDNILRANAIDTPLLNVLVPDSTVYTALLMQPSGEIEASSAGVRNRNRDLAQRQFSSFLDNAVQTRTDLAVTPEYSMPWAVLVGRATRTGRLRPGR